jgi:hypothetical protein
MRRVGIPLICLAFTAGGIVLIAGGETVLGAMCVLFFGVGGLVLALPLLTRRDRSTARTIELDAERALLFPLGTAKQLVAALASAGLAAASVLLVVVGNPLGIVGAVFFGPVAVLLLTGIGRPRGLALTPTRLVALGLGRVEIPWDAVEWAAVMRMSRTRVIAVKATDPGQVRRGWFQRLNGRLTPAEITLAADQLAGPPEEAVAEILRWRDDPAARHP